MIKCFHVPALLLCLFFLKNIKAQHESVSVWLTTSDRSHLFEKQNDKLIFNSDESGGPIIQVNDKIKYQQIDGFGFALTGGSAMHIIHMSPGARSHLIKELFSTDGKNIGISYLRVSIGASDLNEKVFSYDDIPEGRTDPDMKHFDLGPDKQDVIPVLR